MMHNTLVVALVTAALLGFRHGFDYDHIAAITDVVSVQTSRRAAMKLGSIYALGHALMVASLGLIALLIGVHLPPAVDHWAERLVGLTLLALGAYILTTLFLRSGNQVPKSRYMLLHDGFQWVRARVRGRNGGVGHPGDSTARTLDVRSVFFVGVIHGLGAETPSQLMIFLLAVNLGGVFLGIVGLFTFLAGLLVMNMLMTASAAGLFGASQNRPYIRKTLFALTGIYSFAMGVLFIAGGSSLLPAIN